MAKRFTDTDKWKKPFIRSMKAPYKLLWLYILDECDHAGIWHVDFEVAEIRIGEKLNKDTAKCFFEKKVIEFDEGNKWFIPDFISFQYGELNPGNRAHNSVIQLLEKYKLLKDNKPLTSPLQGAMDKDKDKDVDKDMDKDKEKGADFEKIGIAPEMVIAFKNKFPNYPKDQKKDFTACLEIAYKIGEASGFTKNEVIGAKKGEVLHYWQQIINWVSTDNWFSKRALYDLNNEWQRLIQTINNGTKPSNNNKANSNITSQSLNEAHAKYFGGQ